MSRVDEEREVQRYEDQAQAEQAAQEKRKNEDRDFERLVKQKQVVQQKIITQRQNQRFMKKSAASTALLARQGIQANRFQETLQGQATKSNTDTKTQQQTRTTDMQETKRTIEKDQVQEKKLLDKQADRVDAVDRDDKQKNQQGGDMDGNNADKKGFSAGQQMATASGVGATFSPGDVKGAGGPRLSPEVIAEIVKRVMVTCGENLEGLKEFIIEFRENVLAGSRLKVSAKNGKISATFETENADVRRLIKSSEGELARAFQSKGLYLERLEVTGP
jgi:hypothetical protein